MRLLKEEILNVLEKFYPTGLSINQIVSELPGDKKPKESLVTSILSELLDEEIIDVDYSKGLWYAE